MSEAAAAQIGAPPPEAHIAEILLSQLAPRLVHLAATLKLPDCLVEGPRTAEEIAQITATHAPALYRLMRTLTSLQLFAEDAEHRFALRPLGAALKSGTPSHAARCCRARRAGRPAPGTRRAAGSNGPPGR